MSKNLGISSFVSSVHLKMNETLVQAEQTRTGQAPPRQQCHFFPACLQCKACLAQLVIMQWCILLSVLLIRFHSVTEQSIKCSVFIKKRMPSLAWHSSVQTSFSVGFAAGHFAPVRAGLSCSHLSFHTSTAVCGGRVCSWPRERQVLAV